ncbi:MAG: IPT/TIG domain-containing protein [Methylococcaceae bacterium]|nr:IPT/TIG domain-containing protein [Methylococcaceae bacterium]
MAIQLKQVNPGDLIVAEDWNLLIQTVLDLRQDLDALSSSGIGTSPFVTRILPASPPAIWRAGGPLEIQGRNFGFTRGAQRVTFDGINVTAFKEGTNDTNLFIDIPPIPGLPQGGKNVSVVVANGYGSTTLTMWILPVDIPIIGDVIDVFWNSISPNPLVSGIPIFVGYTLRSRAPSTAFFNINPSILSPGGFSNPQVFNSLTQENVNKQFQLATNESQHFFIRIPSIPATVNDFVLETEVTAGSAVGSHTQSLPVGSLIILPDNSIALTPLNFEAINPSNALPDPTGGSYSHADSTIRIRRDRSGNMHLRVEFQNTGTYVVEVSLIGSGAGWIVGLAETPSHDTIDSGDFSGGATIVPKTAMFFVTPPTSGSTTAKAEFRVFRQGSTEGQSRSFNLVLQT